MSEIASDSEAYADGAPLMHLFGQPARAKILSVFVAERGRELSKSEVARQAGVARSTIYDHLDDLERLGVIRPAEHTEGAHSERYLLNEDSEIGEYLYKLEGVTLRRLLELDEV